MADHIKVLREIVNGKGAEIEVDIKTLRLKSIGKFRQALDYAIKCCEIVKRLPSMEEIYNYLPSGEIGSRKTAQAIYDRMLTEGN